jgi:glutamyl-tRNA synthetase
VAERALPEGAGRRRLAGRTAARLRARGVAVDAPGAPDLAAACALFKDRAATLEELADLAEMLWVEPVQGDPRLADELAAQAKPEALPALASLADRLEAAEWTKDAIAAPSGTRWARTD